MTAKDALIEARDFLAAHQWAPHGDGGGLGPVNDPPERTYCAAEALHAVGGSGSGAYAVLLDAARRLSPRTRRSVVAYNDRIAKSKDDVLALYDKAIEMAS